MQYKANESLVLSTRARRHKEGGGIGLTFLTSELDGGDWSGSRPGRFTTDEIAPGTHWIGGCVGLRTGLDAME
jgi:hypothetical protein